MVLSKRCLLSSSLILLKIVIVVTKGMYSIVLKIFREIEFTLKGDENPSLLQNVRFRSKINPSNDQHLVSDFDPNPSAAVNFLIRNFPTGRKVSVIHYNEYEVETYFSEVICEKSNDFHMGRGIVKQTSHPVCFKLDDACPREEKARRDSSLPFDDISAVSQDRKNLQAIDSESFSENSGSAKESSRSKITDSDESLQTNTFHQNIKSNKRTYSKKEISESNLSNAAKHFNKDTKELKHLTKESIDVASLRKSGTNISPDEKQVLESSENPYFEDQESDFDLNTVVRQNKIPRKYMETDLLDQSDISYPKEENNSKNVENRSVKETNEEEVKLSFPKDIKNSKFRLQNNQVATCEAGSTDTKGSSNKCEKKIPNQKLQGDPIRIDTSREPNIEERQEYSETVTEKRSTECYSVSEDKGEVSNEEVCELHVDEEDMQHGENCTTNPPSTSESCRKCQNQALIRFLEEVQPIIKEIEDKVIFMSRVIPHNLSMHAEDLKAIHSLLGKIVKKSRVLNNKTHKGYISTYAKLMCFLLIHIEKDIDTNVHLNHIAHSTYVITIESKLQELRDFLYVEHKPKNSSPIAEQTAETKVSKVKKKVNKKTKKKNKKRR